MADATTICRHWCVVGAALLALLLMASAATARSSSDEELARAQQLVDSGQVEAALELLAGLADRAPADARVLLLRSTALFMSGDTARGRSDLERSLAIDPTLRQAWLNKAALELSEENYAPALEALEKARQLDPNAPDNDLNIGAVQLLLGRLPDARRSFESYLHRHDSSADAFYLVASNYAMAGDLDAALEHFRRAVDLDEKSRLRARTDPNFRDLESSARFRHLLQADAYVPPAGAHRAAFALETPYDGAGGLLVGATLDALQFSDLPIDPRVEVTPEWALIWGQMRIKLSNSPDGKGRVELSAPAEAYTPAEWRQLTEALSREITIQLHRRRR